VKFPRSIDIQPGKLEDLQVRIDRLGIDLASIEEQFVRGGGPGGQKTNKTANAVILRDPDRNLVVRCARDRRRSINRFLALRELVDRIEEIGIPGLSRRHRKIEKIRRRKKGRRRRARRKYGKQS
jgi:protein subunit release factor B